MKKHFSVLAVIAAVAVPGAVAFAAPGHSGHSHQSFVAGEAADPKKAINRTIDIVMKETDDGKMLFAPGKLEIRRGEQVKFVLRNVGETDHEFVLDSAANNAKHKRQMEKNPGMEHDDPNGKRLSPGSSTEVLWHFTKAGKFEFACLIPGHYESGMHGIIAVK